MPLRLMYFIKADKINLKEYKVIRFNNANIAKTILEISFRSNIKMAESSRMLPIKIAVKYSIKMIEYIFNLNPPPKLNWSNIRIHKSTIRNKIILYCIESPWIGLKNSFVIHFAPMKQHIVSITWKTMLSFSRMGSRSLSMTIDLRWWYLRIQDSVDLWQNLVFNDLNDG